MADGVSVTGIYKVVWYILSLADGTGLLHVIMAGAKFLRYFET